MTAEGAPPVTPLFNPLDVEQLVDPYDLWATMRRTCPVAEPFPGMTYVARHRDALEGFRDYHALSNAWVPPGILGGGASEDPEQEQTVQEMDPPRHGPMRRMYLTALSPGRVAEAEPYVREVCARLVAQFAGRPGAELVSELAVPVPSEVIMHMIGVPESDHAQVRAWIERILEMADPTRMMSAGFDDGGGSLRDAIDAFNAYVDDQISLRRRSGSPPDDLITRMIEHVGDDGRRFSDLEIRTQIRFAIMAGNETTTHLIGNLLYTLAARPDLYARLRDDRALVPAAVEESLRHDSPVQVIFRKAVGERCLAGVTIPVDQMVALGIGSANRDDDVYPDAAEYDLDRPRDVNHLAFGSGPHLCVGAPLARLEARAALDAVLDAIPAMSLAPGYAYERVDFFMMRGPKRLDVVF